MASAMRAAATRPKVELTVVAEAPLAGAVRADEVAGPGAVADGVPAAVVELPLGNGATLGRAGPARLEGVAAVVAAVVAATEAALVVAEVLGAELAAVATEVGADVASGLTGTVEERSTESQGSTSM